MFIQFQIETKDSTVEKLKATTSNQVSHGLNKARQKQEREMREHICTALVTLSSIHAKPEESSSILKEMRDISKTFGSPHLQNFCFHISVNVLWCL